MTRAKDEIEFAEPAYYDCECCGHRTTKLTRFVTREGSAFAVYYAHFSDGPDHDSVEVLMGFGPWGEDAPPDARTAIAMSIWNSPESYNVSLVDGDESGWTTEYLGRKLSREMALASQWKQEAFDLSDHIVACDQPVIDYLRSQVRDA